MKNWKEWPGIKAIFDIYHSFFTNDKGMSFRKLGAAYSIWVAMKVSMAVTGDEHKVTVAISWMVFAGVLIGLVTIPELIKFLTRGKAEDPKP